MSEGIAVQPSNLSPLYIACRQNDVNSVKQILSNMSIDEINKIEPNGSTALHVAAYNGHGEIVRLLLDRGASLIVKNRFGLLPAHEARTDEIRKLFEKRGEQNDQNRFVGDANSIEWLTVNERAAEYAAFYQASLKKAYGDGFDRELLVIYLKKIIACNAKGMLDVLTYFLSYFDSNDAKLVLRAYTVESDFYSTINRDLAKMISHKEHIKTEARLEVTTPGAIAALLSYDPKLKEFSFVGDTFRGMLITMDDLNQYKRGSIIMVKSFLSTSKKRSVAEDFSKKEAKRQGPNGELIKFPVVCHYTIRNPYTALAIETISVYPEEEEVIILPINVFKVTSVKEKNGAVEVKLIEQDRLAPLSLDDADSDVAGMFGIMWHFACPCCYRVCCMKCCGVVEHPEA